MWTRSSTACSARTPEPGAAAAVHVPFRSRALHSRNWRRSTRPVLKGLFHVEIARLRGRSRLGAVPCRRPGLGLRMASSSLPSPPPSSSSLMRTAGRRQKRRPLSGRFGQTVEGDKPFQQSRHFVERDHVRPVRKGFFRRVMGLDEQAGDADRHRRPRQDRHELSLAA